MGSDTLDKLRGRSRSGLPSPESEDISRRRESRKGQQPLPVSGLSSLAKIYADDGEKEEVAVATGTNTGKPTGVKEVDVHLVEVNAAPVLAPQTKDNNQLAKSAPKETVQKDKDSVPGKDKQSVKANKTISCFILNLGNGKIIIAKAALLDNKMFSKSTVFYF